ncbi:hypothetical protein Htur_1210 [Haloterrigena turkmenica DSM 5511]|uniref:DUF4129 domain-containing protein n=1 Tax=Haloterrigena turkmenica (strain ATCC 51198 / DSM 5511 / JCM 9101 / NCIMB 13204 / VKM B-1734 / 4k) TaxID=543526 RepID=D2RP67_HALTV|nr:hypothetical protein [Haloterrigena turkmenica]ADB60101.1 hypothetical protein Htur_1210 [Haloterrigena turkmenica DSM 5511]
MTIAVGRTLVLALLLVCLPLTATGSGIAADSANGVDSGSATASVAAQQETPDADGDDADNDTVRHRNPDEYDEGTDQAELERWLSGKLSGQLEKGAIELSEGEAELASEFVGEGYNDRLEQYVEVTGDAERAEAFDEAQSEQEQMTDAVSEYEETKEEYEAARDAGDEERARELARELESLAEEIGDSSQNVRDHYGAISNDSDIDLSDAAAEIEDVNEEVQTEQEAIRDESFVETELTIESTTEEISFTDPLAASGTIETEDGTPIANEEIRLKVGNQTLRTETDETGSFDLEYRPISVPLSADAVTVEYVPENESVYLGSETSVPVDIEQVEPTLTVSDVEPDTVAYGDRVAVDYDLRVGDERVDDVPVVLSIDGTSLGLFGASDGETTGNSTVPADVPSGERDLRVSLPFEDRALASVADSTTVTVAETEPELSISASPTGDREVTVNGTLEAAGGGVDGQSVRIVADGTVLETVSTDADGAFGASVTVPEETATGEVQLVAVHDDEETNLARAEAATTVSFPAASDSLLPTWAWLALGLFAAAVGAGGYWYRDRASASSPESAPGDSDEADGDAPTAPETPDPASTRALLSRASERLSSGDPNDAVRDCYAAVRGTLESRFAASGALTHWEFYRRYSDRSSDSETESAPLRDVTEGYERAAFGPDGVSEREAETILERARELCPEATRSSPADD